jgi:hypothetical protein
MKRIAIGLLTAALCGGPALAAEGAKGGEQTMMGEVLDLACYMAHEGKGAKHVSCARKCLQGGAPAGLLTKDGRLYLLVNDHDAEAAYKSLADMAGAQAKITGPVAKRGGLQAIIVKKAEKGG